MKAMVKSIAVYTISALGALGSALQNYVAVAALLNSLMNGVFAATKASLSLVHGLALFLGGFCSGLVNFCVNVDLLESFTERLFGTPDPEKPKAKLTAWQTFWMGLGSGVFIATGILFGLTAVAFGAMGVLAGLSVAAGVFVAAIMVIQELETWLQSFDNEKENAKSIKQIFQEWKASLTKGKILGVIIAVGNVLALSLLFTFGLASFLIGVGVPALPAVIAGFAVAFTGGAFTEFFFYNRFLSNFCQKINENWQAFWQSKYAGFGLVTSGINAVVNGVLGYVGITTMTSILVAAGIAIPPVGVVIAIGVVGGVFAALASFVLCLEFWKSNSKRLPDFNVTNTSSAALITEFAKAPAKTMPKINPQPIPAQKLSVPGKSASLHFIANMNGQVIALKSNKPMQQEKIGRVAFSQSM